MKPGALFAYFSMMVAAHSGCTVTTRFTVAPTIDSMGGVGADFRMTLTPELSGGRSGGLGADIGVGGSHLGTERVAAAQLRIGPEFSLPAGPTLMRFGVGYSGRFTGSMQPGFCANPTATPAVVLNGVHGYVGLDAPLSDYETRVLQYIALGPELTFEYLSSNGACGVLNRGVFSLGLNLSLSLRIL